MSSGRYCYSLNGEIAPVEETWKISGAAGGEQQVESRRSAGDVTLRVAAKMTSGQVSRCDVGWYSKAAPHVEASFERTETGVYWQRSVGDACTEGLIEKSVEGAVVLYPLMRIFTGPVILALAAAGNTGRVLVPGIANDDEAELLLPDISLRSVNCEGSDPLANHPGSDCQRWSFVGGRYDESAKFWLDQRGILLRYQWQQSESQFWEVELER